MKRKLFTLLIILGGIIVSCDRDQNQTNTLPSNWVSFRPETIPFRVRRQNFDKGNIIPNPSFESGKLYDIQSEQEAFNTPGWRRSGENVHWVDINDSIFEPTEVSSRKHAIKISRKSSDETEDIGEGVISDFIKVIPGHYALSLDIKLENIKSSKARLGTKLYDAIDIRVIYYDKNKIEISPNRYSKHYQTNINTSNKWLSFAHFNKIDSLNWTTVFCESAYPPFPDGYIPNDTRFIKIFIGLKGSGTMWVDNIDYFYTIDNFSLQERLESLYTKEFNAYELLLPIPQKIIQQKQIQLFQDSANTKNILVVYPKNSAIKGSTEFTHFYDKISKYNPAKSNVLSDKEINQNKLIFSFGNTGILEKSLVDSLLNQIAKNKEQGYITKTFENIPNVVFILSKTEQGLNYGINTINQLIDTTNNLFYNADITDWPDFKKRSVTVNSKIDDIDFQKLTSDLRFNTAFLPYGVVLEDTYNKQGVIINQYINNGKTDPNFKNNPLLIKTLSNPETKLHLSSVEDIWYCKEFTNLEKLNQIDLATQNKINATADFKPDGIIWKGTSEFSPNIDNLDYIRINEYTNIPIVLSISLLNTPYELPVNGNNLLAMPYFRISGTMFEKIQQINFEMDSLTLLNKLKLTSMSCYCWNVEKYNPDEILYKILLKSMKYEGDLLKLISLSDKLKLLMWKNYHAGDEKIDTIDTIDYSELINNYRFEDKNMDSIILKNIKKEFREQ